MRRLHRTPRLVWGLAALALVASAGWSTTAQADEWQVVAPGVTFQEFTLPGPNHAFVARMDIASPDVTIESSIASGALASGVETVSEMARRYDGTLSAWGGFWGPRQRVVVAVNGSSYHPETGEPYGGLIYDGWYALRFGEAAGTSGLAWTSDRHAVIGGCISNPVETNVVTNLRTGVQVPLRSVNRDLHGLTLYTPQYDVATPENGNAVEAILDVSGPLGLAPASRGVDAVVREVRRGGGTPLAFDRVVLAARGAPARELMADLRPGDVLAISQEISDLGGNCRSAPRLDWSNVYASIGGGFEFLRRGVVRHSDDAGAYERDPRTAFCVSETHVDFVVVDGREDAYSVGMTLDELAEFCRDELEDNYGINQDGGGSSAMWVNGRIVNRPSDGFERGVANGLMMTVIEPPLRSNRFSPGYRVLVQQSGDIRLGPGTNYAARGSLRPGTLVDLLPGPPLVRGIYATGMYWWKVLYDGEEGWVAESSLVGRPEALAIFEIPARFPSFP